MVSTAVAKSVVALGPLEPQGGVIKLAVSSKRSRIAQLFVNRCDRAQPGQVIATLDSCERLQTALEQATRKVHITQTKLAQVRSRAKLDEINAQKASILYSQAQLE